MDNILNSANEWLKYAYNDINSFKVLYSQMSPPPLEIILFHCRQCVEKALKAFLVFNDCFIDKTHDLYFINEKCKSFDKEFSKFTNECKLISVYAVRTRYPNEIQIDQGIVDIAIKFSESVLSTVREKIINLEHERQI